MAIYAELFDGTRLEFPDGTDPEVIDRVAREETLKRQPKVAPPEPKESTIAGEAMRGARQFISTARTGVGAGIGSPEEAARAGLERAEKIEAEAGEGPSLERIQRVYRERGLLPAAGQVASDVPRFLAQQAPQIGATIAGAKLGAMAGSAIAPGPGTLIGAGLGAIGANVPSTLGAAVQRQAATQIEEGKPVDISMGRAAAATAGSAALEAAGTAGVLGKNLVKRLLGVGDDAALAAARSKEDLVKAARATIAGGAVRGAAVEMPVEVAQSVLDRWQAGLDVTGDDALKEYGESLYAAGLVGGPIGGASAIPTRRAAQRALEEQEPLAPGQRRGETLEQTANRLNTEVQGLTGELQPPPPSPFLSDEQLASIAASENGFGKLVQYEEKIKQEPSSPERNASLQASREFRRRLEIESQQRQTEPGKAYPFDPYAPEPFQFKSSTELVDLINKIEDPADKLTRILEYRAEVKAQPASAAREQALKDSSALYDEVNKFVQAQGFPAPTPFTLRTSDLTAAGIDRKDPLFEQLKGKDINKPDDVDTVVKLTEEAQRRPNITPELFDRLEGLLTSVEAHLRDRPGSGFYGQRTYPKPSGTGVSVAGQPEPTVPTGGAEPSGRMGMVGPTAPAEPTVSREKVAPTPVDEFLRTKPRAEFARAIGASGGDELKARRDNPNLKAAVKGENLGGVLNALTRSKSPVVAEVARRGAPAGTTVKIDDDAVEKYVGRSFLDDRFIIAEAKNLLALRDAIKNKTSFIETVVVDQEGNTKNVERLANDPVILRANPYWMVGLKQKDVTEFTLPQLEQAVDNKIAELGEDQLKLTATASAIRTGVAGGAYDPDTKTIRLAEYFAKNEGVVTHELVHAQVVEAVANPTKEQRPHVERLNKLYEHVKANAKERGLDFYGVSSIQEFIAEGMSNPRFQFFLNTIPYEKQSAWTKFVQTIADLLGIKNNTAFLELLTVYDRITPPVKSKAKVAPARTPSQEEALAETFPPSAETAFEPGLEIGEPEPDPELLAAVKKLEAERDKAQKTKVLPKGQIFSLLSAVKGKLTISDTLDVSPDKNMRVLTAKSNGTFISELVNNGVLDKWLPPDKRPESNTYDVQESEEYIKELLRNRDHAPYAVKEKLDQLNLQIRNIDDAIEQEKQLDILIRQANAELQAASEERRAEEAELPAAEREARDTVRAEGITARKSLAKVAPQVSEKKFQELERRAKQPSKPEPAKEEPEEVKAIRAERAEKIDQLQGVLEKILAKYGLKDVKLNLEEGMKDEGSYEGQLIKLALDLDNPVRTLRHEAIHALKELGFFTPQQWKVLTDRAKSEWVDKYLKNQIAIVDGKEVTRYDAYMDLYKGDQDKIVEEAIADAFGDFVKTKAPPGMMQAILTRMKNLFKAIKETFNQGGYQTAEDVFGKIEEGKLTKAEKLVQDGGEESVGAPAGKAGEPAKKSLRAREVPKDSAKAFFKAAEKLPRTKGIEAVEEAWSGGVADFGDRDAAKYLGQMPGYSEYASELETIAWEHLAGGLYNKDKTVNQEAVDRDGRFYVYRYGDLTLVDEINEGSYEGQFEAKSTTLSINFARAFANFAAFDEEVGVNRGWMRMAVKPEAVIMVGSKSSEMELVVDLGNVESGTAEVIDETFQPESPEARFSLRSQTPELKFWFGQSKIVDEDGKPKVMYHGTARDITSFVPKQAGAIFVTDDPNFAETFSKMSADWMAKHADQFLSPEQLKAGREAAIKQIKKDYRADPKLRDKLLAALDDPKSMYATDANEILAAQYKDQLPTGPNIMPVFVRAENPFDFDNREHIRQLQQYEAENRYTPNSISDKLSSAERGSWQAIEDPLVQQAIKQLGFDGFYVKEGGKKNLAVYSSNQIKSAIGNQGTYDITNADIRKSLRTLPTLPTDVTDRIKQTVIPRERPGMVDRLLDAISPRTFSKFRSEFVNRYDALARFDRQAAEQIRLMGGTEQLADAKAESAALFSDLSGGLAASAMGVNDRVGGIPVYVRKYIVEKDFKKIGPDYTTKAAAEAAAKQVGGQVFEQGYTTISNANGVKGLIAIFSDLAKYKKPAENEPSVFDQYQFWADVKRASKYILNPGTGKYEEKLFTKDDIRRAAQIEQAFPEFVQIQKEWIKYNDGLVDFMRDTGVISEAGAKEMKKHGDYFPFYRHLGEDDIQGPRLFSSIANVKSVKAAKGSEAEVTDFFETIVRNTQSAIQSGIKNVAARRATDQAMRIGEVFKLNRAESGPSVYRVLENGKETYYRAQDPYFIDALKSLNQPDLPFIGLLAGPAKLLRNLVTKDPAFQLANMMRDSLSAYVSSGYKFTPIAATLKQYGSIIAGKSAEVEALRKAGVVGGYDYSQGVETSAQKLEKEMRKVAGAKTTLEKIASPVTSLWGALEKSSEASDAATRNEIYKRVLAETGNEAEALYQALEVMNFNRKGRSPIIRILTAAVPFMNARIQGLDVLYRAGMRPIFGKDATEQEKARLKTFWVRGMTMMALSSMYWVLTSDDEEYKKQEQEVRDNYWLFPSLGIKIPIPFEIGVMFKVVPERILEYAFGSDTGEDFRKAMGRHLMSTFGFNPVPQTFLPAIEITANYSFFTQRPIITQGMENISPEYQVGPNTSKIAGAIGQSLGISPIKLDYLIQGYTGTMGMYAVNLFDSIFSMNDEAPKPSRRLEQMPVLRRFMVDPEARGQITAYYDLKNSVDQVVRTSNYLERSMDFEQYGKYMQENIKMLSARDYINDLEKTMKEFREMKNLIRISKIDADEKRDSLTNIGRMEQQLTQNIKTLKKQLAAQQ